MPFRTQPWRVKQDIICLFTSSKHVTDDFTPCADLIFFPGGDSDFSAHVPSASEDSGEEEQQDEGKGEEREDDRTSVEVQIGRKLREIGDHFQQEQMQLVRGRT